MSRIIERALSIINDNLKDQTSSFADPISIKPMARGGHVLEDDYPTHYLPHIGRQVMADGGAPRGFEGRVMAPTPVEEPVAEEGISAYHGSPYEFEKFDTSKIGTGEGAQAYGHGLYFAENPEVAQAYRSRLAGRPEIKGLTLAGHTVGPHNGFDYSPRTNSTYENLRSSLFEDLLINEDALLADPSNVKDLAINTLKDRMKDLPDEWPEAVPHAEKLLKDLNRANGAKLKLGETPGKMYEVRLNMGQEHLLNWDKPLKGQQAYDAVRKHWDEKLGDPDIVAQRLELNDESTGEDLYNALSRHQRNPEDASKMLNDIGVRGIRYLDAGSRGQDGHTGSHNIVVFDPQHIKIKRKYAKGGEVLEKDDEGIVAYAFGNSVPHIEERIASGVEPQIKDTFESSSIEHDLLRPIGKSRMIGDEDELFNEGVHSAGIASNAMNNKKSIRYLHHDENGNPVGALQIMTHGPRSKKATIQNVYVAEDHRRKKIASNLLNRARRDFDVKHSKDLTTQGKAFAKAAKAYGGSIIPGPRLTEDNADDFARRLIAWTFATAPLFQRAAGGSVIDDAFDVLSKLRR